MSTQNSTNVRTHQQLLRHGYRALDALFPKAAAELAARLFVRAPPRRRDSNRQRDVLKTGERFDLRLGDQHLAVWKWGDGPRVLLVHGWGGSAGQLDEFVTALTGAGFSAVAFDAPAHGASSGAELSLPLFASAIERVSALVGPLHGVIAHSLGGPATALAMQHGLRLGRAVFVAPPADALDWFKKFSTELELGPGAELAARQRIEQRLGVPFEQLNEHALGPYIDVPLLVIHDRLDKQVPWSDGDAVVRAAGNATLLTTEGLGHQRILRSARVLDDAIAFLKAEPIDLPGLVESKPSVGCAHCQGAFGSMYRPDGKLCPQCELELELFDRASRWSAQSEARRPITAASDSQAAAA